MSSPRRNRREAAPTSRAPAARAGLPGAAALASTLLVALIAAWRCAFWWGLRWGQDDAYISFRYAKHLVEGHGLVYNVGERVEGYTNFLWTLISALPLALGARDPLPFMQVVSLACWLAATGALLWFLFAAGRRAFVLAPLALLPLLQHWSYNLWYFSGMETGLVATLATLGVLAVALEPERHRWSPLLASTAGALLTMARADGLVLWAALALASLLCGAPWRGGRRAALRGALLWLAPVLLLWLPYTLWRVTYYGSFFPNTYYAKVAYLSFWSRGWTYLRTFLAVYPQVWLLPLVAAAAPLAPAGPLRRFLLAAFCTSAAAMLYVVRLGGDFMEWRFLVPVLGVYYPALALALGVLLARALAGGRAAEATSVLPNAVLGVVAVTLWVSVAHSASAARDAKMEGQEVIGELERYCDPRQFDWGEVGRAFDRVFPKDLRMATTSAGIIPFVCDRWTLDLHGLNDRQIAHQPIDPAHRGRMGHEHSLEDLGAMRARGADVFLPWAFPKPTAFASTQAGPGGRPLVSVHLPSGRWADFVVLDSTRLDLAALRRDSTIVVSSAPAAAPAR